MPHTPRLRRTPSAPNRRHVTALLAAAAVGLAGLAGPDPAPAADTSHDHGGNAVTLGALTVAHAWARPNLPNRPTAAYLHVMNNGTAGDVLVSAASPQFESVEMHATTKKDGVMTMFRLREVAIGAGEAIRFDPGGMHLMLFGAASRLKPGDHFVLRLTFRDAGTVEIMVPVSKHAVTGETMDHDGHMDHSGKPETGKSD